MKQLVTSRLIRINTVCNDVIYVFSMDFYGPVNTIKVMSSSVLT